MPLANEFIQHLEDIEASGQPCNIKFLADNGGVIFMKAKIIELYNGESEGYLRTDKGARIKFERLIEVDGQPPQYLA